jgi:predicted TIM-barrel fold metal-dependent hydrolase
VCLVSCDSHIGPSPDKLRKYCERKYLDAFDDFYAHPELSQSLRPGVSQRREHKQRMLQHVSSTAEQDSDGRLREMEEDGVVAEVIFHGSQNANVLPFGYGGTGDRSLESIGITIYNRWLADFCAQHPGRRVGLIQVPGWSPEECVREVIRANSDGLHAINFPSLRPSDQERPLYTNASWEPFWEVCESLDLPLANHGAADLDILRDEGVGNYAIVCAEVSWLARRTAWWLIFNGVFDRHPALKFVITEQSGEWPRTDLPHLDSAYHSANVDGVLGEVVEHEPSWYYHNNIWFGGSFLSNREVRMYLELGLSDRLLWGSDYPHIEGTWPNTTLSLRKTFEGIDSDTIRGVAGYNAIDVFNLDRVELTRLAQHVGPTMDTLREPLSSIPNGMEYSLAFREHGAFH